MLLIETLVVIAGYLLVACFMVAGLKVFNPLDLGEDEPMSWFVGMIWPMSSILILSLGLVYLLAGYILGPLSNIIGSGMIWIVRALTTGRKSKTQVPKMRVHKERR